MPDMPAIAPPRLKTFISYARLDVGFAEQLRLALEDRGFDVLIDRKDIGAEDFMARLTAIIRSSDTVIFVLTEAWTSSEACQIELAHAVKLGKRIISVAPGPIAHSALPLELASINYIHFYQDASTPGSGFYDGVLKVDRALRTDLDWVRRQSQLSEAADLWAATGSPGRLLVGEALADALKWRGSQPSGSAIQPTLKTFIDESEAAERRRIADEAANLADRLAALTDKEAALAAQALADRRLRRITVGGIAVIIFATIALCILTNHIFKLQKTVVQAKEQTDIITRDLITSESLSKANDYIEVELNKIELNYQNRENGDLVNKFELIRKNYENYYNNKIMKYLKSYYPDHNNAIGVNSFKKPIHRRLYRNLAAAYYNTKQPERASEIQKDLISLPDDGDDLLGQFEAPPIYGQKVGIVSRAKPANPRATDQIDLAGYLCAGNHFDEAVRVVRDISLPRSELRDTFIGSSTTSNQCQSIYKILFPDDPAVISDSSTRNEYKIRQIYLQISSEYDRPAAINVAKQLCRDGHYSVPGIELVMVSGYPKNGGVRYYYSPYQLEESKKISALIHILASQAGGSRLKWADEFRVTNFPFKDISKHRLEVWFPRSDAVEGEQSDVSSGDKTFKC
jgi:hypothetical protein